MELILNELSFDGQFQSYDDFIDTKAIRIKNQV